MRRVTILELGSIGSDQIDFLKLGLHSLRSSLPYALALCDFDGYRAMTGDLPMLVPVSVGIPVFPPSSY